MAGKFDPKLFFQDVKNVALHVPARELFGLLKRSLDLPPQWAAMIHKVSGDHVIVPASGQVDATDAEDILFVRATPVTLSLDEEGIVTKDRFECRANVRLSVSVMTERGELQSFLKSVVGSHRVAQAHGLASHLSPSVRAGLAQYAAEHEGSELVEGTSAEQLSAAVAKALEAPLFAAGMILDGTPAVCVESKTLRHVRQSEQDAARRRAEHAAAREVQTALDKAQGEHLEHLSGLLTRLKELAAKSPDVELPELIRTFSERERGELYEALFASETPTTRTRWIVAIAGDEVLFFAPDDLETPARRVTVTGEVGPVRSIQTAIQGDGTPVLLLGAATGVYRLPLDAAEPDLALVVEPMPSVRGGFNAVALAGDRVFASHSELGVFEWNVTDVAPGRLRFASMTRDAKAVRGVVFEGGDLYCAIDDRVIRWPADVVSESPTHIYTGSESTITAICPVGDELFAGNGDGEVLRWKAGRDTLPERVHSGSQRAVESVWGLASHGVRRLVYTDTSLGVHAQVVGDAFTCRYDAGGQTLRRVEVAPDLLVATNDLRDRLICWTPGEPDKPARVISVSRIVGRSVQDVCLVG